MEESLSNIGFSKIGRDQADLIGQIEKLISVHDVVRSQPAFDQTKFAGEFDLNLQLNRL